MMSNVSGACAPDDMYEMQKFPLNIWMNINFGESSASEKLLSLIVRELATLFVVTFHKT